MQVHLTLDLKAKLNHLPAETGRAKEKLVQDAMVGYLAELSQFRSTLDRRYDDIKSRRTKPIGSEDVYRKEEVLLFTIASKVVSFNEKSAHLTSWRLIPSGLVHTTAFSNSGSLSGRPIAISACTFCAQLKIPEVTRMAAVSF